MSLSVAVALLWTLLLGSALGNSDQFRVDGRPATGGQFLSYALAPLLLQILVWGVLAAGIFMEWA